MFNIFEAKEKSSLLNCSKQCMYMFHLKLPCHNERTIIPLSSKKIFFFVNSSSAEDDIFMNLSLVKKGKKLITRALPLLFQNQVFAIFFVYMRNLALLVTSPRLDMVNNVTSLVSILVGRG
jgi:hypothetical protein